MAESSFGKNLKRIREERGLTQTQLAQMITTNRVSISEWENGVRYPQVIWVYRLAEKLGVKPSDLL